MKKISFSDFDLASKYGFKDGEILRDYYKENNIDEYDADEFLFYMVKRHLEKSGISANVYYIMSGHNSVRVDEEIESFDAEISYSEIDAYYSDYIGSKGC